MGLMPLNAHLLKRFYGVVDAACFHGFNWRFGVVGSGNHVAASRDDSHKPNQCAVRFAADRYFALNYLVRVVALNWQCVQFAAFGNFWGGDGLHKSSLIGGTA